MGEIYGDDTIQLGCDYGFGWGLIRLGCGYDYNYEVKLEVRFIGVEEVKGVLLI